MIFLDSTFLIQLIRRNDEAINKLKLLKDQSIITSVINIYEIWLGFYKNKMINSNQDYKQIIEERITKLTDSLQILEFNKLTARLSAEIGGLLLADGKDIGDKGSIIAGIMKSYGIKFIITANVQHFERVKDLIVLDQNGTDEQLKSILGLE